MAVGRVSPRLAWPVFGVAVLAFLLGAASSALAACPLELAVYGDRDGAAEIDFRPKIDSATATNSFRMFVGDVVLDGMVEWSDGAARPHGVLTQDCPQGDATGDELAACTLWNGVIYTSDEEGNIGLLPAQGAVAPATLVFAGLGPSLHASALHEAGGMPKLPWDVFALKGCQE